MKRAVARRQTWWTRLFVAAVLAAVILPVPQPWGLVVAAALFALSLVRPPATTCEPVEVDAPLRGRWVVVNGPGTAVPSHGITAYGQAYAVDVLQPAPDARTSVGWGLRPRHPESYPAFARPVHAMADGTVVRARGAQRDHGARDTWPLLVWMMTVEGFLRDLAGVGRILGNHVVVRHEDGTVAVYAHLRRDSPRVREGEAVRAGQVLAEVGNTGNTSEPHLHVQVMDREQATAAAGVPMRWRGVTADGERDPRWSTAKRRPTALPDFPENGHVLELG
ncbi:Peptidase family M23 [Georgenia satyanarayanai]|uniref:Peptidase family M23 n=1 Tax=Georgenia satyanarayanai TaxID=860221 RepID=A0A2Y9AC90_9MICO|nr:M23 family metallopeptidase [Georgenia satyanarayanai]PYG00120.1 peptidase M23-like protein [Georgenia satyanarayanai]SSA40169.1 Peptidase family M23 [Georgenia satyanarayanai]